MPLGDMHQPDPEVDVVLDEMVDGGHRRLIEQSGPFRFWVLQGHDATTTFAATRAPDAIADASFVHDGWMGVDVGFHSPVPQRPQQFPMPCRWLRDSDHCYYGGSSLRAVSWAQAFRDGDWDDDAIFRALYRNLDDLRTEIANPSIQVDVDYPPSDLPRDG